MKNSIKMKPILLFLTCANKKETDKIIISLLKNRLIACAKQFPVLSQFWWKGQIDSDKEILLMMESEAGLFEEVEKEVRKIHSYDTFVLISIPIKDTSKGVREWMKEELKQI